jgi:hypothetical protein
VAFAGWTVTRFVIWPHETLAYDISIGGHMLALLGIAASMVAAWGVIRYRRLTGQIAWLIHAGATLITLDLIAWKIEVARDTLPRINNPGGAMWELLVVGWIIFGALAHIADLRSR